MNPRIARDAIFAVAFLTVSAVTLAQSWRDNLQTLTSPQDYVQNRSSSYDRTGGNEDYRAIPAGQTMTLLDVDGPGEITHVWITIASPERFHLKKIVLRMFWDGEATPSVEAPVGDFFGLGLGDYFLWQSAPIQVGGDKALNSFFPMPFRRHARIVVENQGREEIGRAHV